MLKTGTTNCVYYCHNLSYCNLLICTNLYASFVIEHS